MTILEWRERMGWTQSQAAQALGVSVPTYQRQELGKNLQTGQSIEPDRRTRLACAALLSGLAPI